MDEFMMKLLSGKLNEMIADLNATDQHKLVSWSLRSHFGTNMAISGTMIDIRCTSLNETTCRWLYCAEYPQYSIRLEALDYLYDGLSGRGQG